MLGGGGGRRRWFARGLLTHFSARALFCQSKSSLGYHNNLLLYLGPRAPEVFQLQQSRYLPSYLLWVVQPSRLVCVFFLFLVCPVHKSFLSAHTSHTSHIVTQFGPLLVGCTWCSLQTYYTCSQHLECLCVTRLSKPEIYSPFCCPTYASPGGDPGPGHNAGLCSCIL